MRVTKTCQEDGNKRASTAKNLQQMYRKPFATKILSNIDDKRNRISGRDMQ